MSPPETRPWHTAASRRRLHDLQNARYAERVLAAYPGVAALPRAVLDVVNLEAVRIPPPRVRRSLGDLEVVLNVTLVLYRQRQQRVRGIGLCELLDAARLTDAALALLQGAERRLRHYVIVAYTAPLRLRPEAGRPTGAEVSPSARR